MRQACSRLAASSRRLQDEPRRGPEGAEEEARRPQDDPRRSPGRAREEARKFMRPANKRVAPLYGALSSAYHAPPTLPMRPANKRVAPLYGALSSAYHAPPTLTCRREASWVQLSANRAGWMQAGRKLEAGWRQAEGKLKLEASGSKLEPSEQV